MAEIEPRKIVDVYSDADLPPELAPNTTYRFHYTPTNIPRTKLPPSTTSFNVVDLDTTEKEP